VPYQLQSSDRRRDETTDLSAADAEERARPERERA
jgi:hypothetical protein